MLYTYTYVCVQSDAYHKTYCYQACNCHLQGQVLPSSAGDGSGDNTHTHTHTHMYETYTDTQTVMFVLASLLIILDQKFMQRYVRLM